MYIIIYSLVFNYLHFGSSAFIRFLGSDPHGTTQFSGAVIAIAATFGFFSVMARTCKDEPAQAMLQNFGY
jgi:hypothetical protein